MSTALTLEWLVQVIGVNSKQDLKKKMEFHKTTVIFNNSNRAGTRKRKELRRSNSPHIPNILF